MFCYVTNHFSPHEYPFISRVANAYPVGSVRYIVSHGVGTDRASLGWVPINQPWVLCVDGDVERQKQANELIRSADLVMFGDRAHPLLAERANAGQCCLIGGERWFKPPYGMWRLVSPKYFVMAWRFVKMLRTRSVTYLPCGVHAATDMARLCGLFGRDLRCLFCAPKLEFERVPGGKIHLSSQSTQGSQSGGWSVDEMRYGLNKMRLWGYFVEPSNWSDEKLKELRANQREAVASGKRPLRVLWVGRMLDCKRVDTLIGAVQLLNRDGVRAMLTLVGYGPEENRLKRMAMGHDEITFRSAVPIGQVRELMREHDLYVLPSNGFEGWGAVVSEALAEQMPVIGTYEAGASGTMLMQKDLFHTGCQSALAKLLVSCYADSLSDGRWAPDVAASFLSERLYENHSNGF